MGYIINVFKAQVVDNETKEVLATSLLQSSEIQRQLQSLEIRTGVGNSLVASIQHSPDTSINLSHTEVAYPWIARQLGQTVTTGEGTGWKFLDSYTTIDGGSGNATVTLEEAPLGVGEVIIKNAAGVSVTGFTVTEETVDFTAATPTIAVGDAVQITYQFKTDANTQIIEIDDSVFPKGATVILETLEVDGKNQPIFTIQYEFYNCVPDGNITIQTQASPQAQSNAMNMKVVNLSTNGSSKVGEIRRIPITA